MLAKFLVASLVFLSAFGHSERQVSQATTPTTEIPDITIEPVYPIRLPGANLPEYGITDAVDSNSPMHWDENGNFYAFASAFFPFRSSGKNLYTLSPTTERAVIRDSMGIEGGKWLEATWHDDDGTLYGWYHNEPPNVCANNPNLTAPRIGAMISHDEGLTWDDLGIVLQAPDDSLDCETQNYYFAGGNGDFSVMLDPGKNYFYFFFDTYHSQIDEQGVSIARMSYADRNQPAGKVWKWRDGNWDQPGLGGRVTPIIPVMNDWHLEDADAYWGPSIHFNTYLNSYVIVLNRAIDRYWNQEGIYICFNDDLSNPLGWTLPDRLPLDPLGAAYPQIVGIEKGGTDKLAGRSARLFLLGQSRWQISFRLPGDGDDGDCGDCVGEVPARAPLWARPSPIARQGVRAARPSLLKTPIPSDRKKISARTVNN